METLENMRHDVGHGGFNVDLPDWRVEEPLEVDESSTPEDVKFMLGFDPAEE